MQNARACLLSPAMPEGKCTGRIPRRPRCACVAAAIATHSLLPRRRYRKGGPSPLCKSDREQILHGVDFCPFLEVSQASKRWDAVAGPEFGSAERRGAWLTQWSVACGARSFSWRRDFRPVALQDRKARTGPVSTSVLCNKVGQVGGRYRDHRPVQMSKYSGLRRLRPARRPCWHRSIDIPSALAETRENLVPLDDEIWRYNTRWRIRILRTADTWLMAPPAENRLAAQKVDEGPKIFFTVCARGRRGHATGHLPLLAMRAVIYRVQSVPAVKLVVLQNHRLGGILRFRV